MLDLNLSQLVILGVGALLVLAGVAGLWPMLANLQKPASPGESREPSPRPLDAFAASPAPAVAAAVAAWPAIAAPAVDPVRSAAEELMARLFSIRMLVSDLTSEVQSIRETMQEAERRTYEEDALSYGEIA